MKNKIIVIATLLLMIFTMVGCSKDDDKMPFYSTDEEVFATETPYCELAYPTEWEKKVDTKTKEKNDSYVVSYTATIDGKEIKLFDIAFGGNKGDLLGTFEHEGETVKVYVIEHIKSLDDFEDDDRMTVGAMLDDINVIISKLIEDYDFEIAQ